MVIVMVYFVGFLFLKILDSELLEGIICVFHLCINSHISACHTKGDQYTFIESTNKRMMGGWMDAWMHG